MYHYVPDDYLKIYRQANPPLLPKILGTAPSGWAHTLQCK